MVTKWEVGEPTAGNVSSEPSQQKQLECSGLPIHGYSVYPKINTFSNFKNKTFNKNIWDFSIKVPFKQRNPLFFLF